MASAEATPKRSWRIESTRTAKLILWTGIVAAFVGFVVSAEAWAGDHIYDRGWFPVMLFGMFLMIGGMLVAGYARAMGPRGLAKKRSASPSAKPTAQRAVPAAKPTERLELKCPQCATRFVAEGVRPFKAECPKCKFSAELS